MSLARRLLWLSLFAALGCSSSSSHSAATSTTVTGCPKGCPNDPPLSASDNADCVANTKDPSCGAEAQAFYSCATADLKCDSSGVTDTAALMASCGSAKGAWETCQTGDAGPE